MPTIVFTCGGTGGHVYPAISLAQELAGEFGVHFLGTSDREDHRIVRAYDFAFTAIGTRHWTVGNVFKSVMMGVRMLRRLGPEVVVSTGGGQTAIVVFCAWLLRIPVILLEQNAIPGRTNRWLSHLATRVITAFTPRPGDFDLKKTETLGNPVRKSYVREPWFDDFSRAVPVDWQVLLVFGGSQGARALNAWVADHYSAFIAAGFTVIHLTGSQHGDTQTPWTSLWEGRVFQLSYAESMDWLYERASLVLSRAGATSIAELMAYRKKAILVPFPFAKDDHQRANARLFCEKYPGVVIEETQLSWDGFQAAMTQLDTQVFPHETMNARDLIATQIRGYLS